MNTDGLKLSGLSERIIGCGFAVANALGVGCVEKVHENALAHELRKSGLGVRPLHGITVRHDGIDVDNHAADLLVEDSVIVELKAVKALDDMHRAQCLNYLKATGLQLCLLMNFGRLRLEIGRLVL